MIIAIVGPTGVGKTKLSLALAKKYQGIIINCDAVQIYQELNIGSAKIKPEEMEGIPHYLMNIVSPEKHYTVYDYQKDIRTIIEENKDKTIIIVGGTGLYLKAGLYDYQFGEEQEKNQYEQLSDEEIYQFALQKDPNCKMHPHNRQRLVRFLNQKIHCVNSKSLYNAIYIGLTTNRDSLYKGINQRVDSMIEEGLVEEVNYLLKKYPTADILNSAIGYKEIKRYLNNEITLSQAIEEIKKNTRHYAKRQYTFFKNQLPVEWFLVEDTNFNLTVQNVIDFIEKQKS